MANQRIDIDVGLKIDKTGLNQIKSSLQEIKNLTAQDLMKIGGHNDIQKAEQELKSLKASISQIDGALEKAFNTDLGTLNVSKFNQALKGMNLNQVYKDFSAAGAAGQSAFRNVTSQILTTNMQLKQTHNFLNNMATTMANTVKWGVASSVMNNFTGSVQKAYGYVKSLDSSLNDIRIVTNKSAEEMDKFAVKANNAAKALGKSTTDYTDASLIYYQQGLSDKDVEARAETTLKAANVTGQSGEAVSEQLTAVWNGYKVSAEEAELYIDKLAAVAATTASDLEELSTGMSKVASAANLMGVDIDSLNAQMATIVSVTRQAPESVGTALKTIYARMGDIEAGLDAETTLGNYTKEMKAMGVNVLDANGKLRDMGDVINEIGGNWKNMTREQQLSLSQTMAGTRQYNNLLSLFDNWDMYTKALDTSANAAGTLQKQQDTYMESTQAHLNQLRAASEDLYDSLLDPKGINPVIDGLTAITNLMSNFVDSIGGGGNILLALGSIGTKVFSQQLASGIATFITNLQNAKDNAAQLRAELEITQKYQNSNINDSQIKTLVDMKRQVLDLDKSITNEERNIANEYINQQNELYKQQDALKQKAQEAQKLYENLTGTSISVDPNSGKGAANLGKELLKEAGEFEQYTSKANATRKSILELTAARRQFEEARGKTISFAAQAKDFQPYQKAIDDTKQKIQDYIKMVSSLQNKGKLSPQGVEDVNNSYEKLKKVVGDVNQIQLSNGKHVAALKTYYEETSSTIQKTGSSIVSLAHDMDSLESQLSDNKKYITELQQSYTNFLNGIELRSKIQQNLQLVSSFGQLASAMTSIGNMDSIWSNENLSAGEKMLQTVTNLGFALPMLANSLGKILPLEAAIGAARTKQIATLVTRNGLETSYNALVQKGVPQQLALDAALAKKNGNTAFYNQLLTIQKKLNHGVALSESEQIFLDEALAASKRKVGLAAIFAQGGLKAFWGALGLMGQLTVIVVALAAAAKAFDHFHTSAKEAGENLDASIESFKEAKSELESLESELETTKNRMEELLSMDSLTLTDKEELNELQKQNAELEAQIELLKQKVELENRKVARDAKEAVKKGTYDDKSDKTPFYTPQTKGEEAEIVNSQKDPDTYKSNFRFLQTSESLDTSGFKIQKGEIKTDDKSTFDTWKADAEKLYEQALQKATDATGETADKWTEVANAIKKDITDTEQNYQKARDDRTESLEAGYNAAIEALPSLRETNVNGNNDSDIQYYEDAVFDYFESAGSLDNIVTTAISNLGLTEQQQTDLATAEKIDESSLIDIIGSENLESLKTYFETIGLNLEDSILHFQEINGLLGLTEEEIAKKREELAQEKRDELTNTINTDYADLNKESKSGTLQSSDLEQAGFTTEDIENWATISQYLDENIVKTKGWTEALKEAKTEAASVAEEAESDQRLGKAAEEYGLDVEELKNYRDLLAETEEAVGMTAEAIDDAAVTNKRMEKGIKTLAKNWDDLNEIMSDSESTAEDISSVMTSDVQEALQEILDIDTEQFELLPPDFAQKNWNLIQDAVNGVEGGVEALRNAAQTELGEDLLLEITPQANMDAFGEEINRLNSFIAEYDTSDFQVGVSLDPVKEAEFYGACQSIINAAGMTQREATRYFGNMGYNVEFDNQPQTVSEVVWEKHITTKITKDEDGNVTAKKDSVSGTPKVLTGTVDLPTIKTITPNGSFGGGKSIKNSAPKSARKSSGSGGGGGGKGGGGGGKAKKTKVDKQEKTADRYHNINNQIDKLATKFDRLADAQDRLHGKELYDNLNKQLKVINQQIKASKEKLKIAKEEKKELQDKLKKEGFKFDIDGDISNYKTRLERLRKTINDKVSKYNKMSAKSQNKKAGKKLAKQIEKLKEEYAEIEDWIKQYDDLLVNTIPELEDEVTQLARTKVEIQVEKLKIKADLTLDISEALRQWEDFKREIFESDNPFDEMVANRTTMENIMASNSIYENAKALNIVNQGIADMEKGKWTKYSDQFILKDNKGNPLKDENGNYKFDEQAARDLQEQLQENVQGEMEEFYDAARGAYDAYLNSVEGFIDASKDYHDALEDVQDVLDHTMNMITMLKGEDAFDDIETILDQKIDSANTQIKALQKNINYYTKTKAWDDPTTKKSGKETTYIDRLEKLAEKYKGEISQLETELANEKDETKKAQMEVELSNLKMIAQANQEELDMTREAIKDMQADLMANVEEYTELMLQRYQNAVSKALKNFNTYLGGALGNEGLSKEWENAIAQEDRYLDKVNTAYELRSLENKINESINDTDSLSAQKKLNEFKEKELKLLREKDKLTQYDIDRANKLYEIELKKIALEEAQQNKSQMRLRRDASGNYSYQFVADEDSISKAQQELDAAQNDLYNMEKGEYRSRTEELNQVKEDFTEFNQWWSEQSIEYRKNNQDWYNEQVKSYEQQMKDVAELAHTARNQTLETANDLMGADFNETVMEEMLPTWDTAMAEMVDKVNNENGFKNAMTTALNSISEASETLALNLQTLEKLIGAKDSKGGLANTSNNYYQEAKTGAEEYAEAQEENLRLTKEQWAETRKLYTELNKLLTTLGKFGKIDGGKKSNLGDANGQGYLKELAYGYGAVQDASESQVDNAADEAQDISSGVSKTRKVASLTDKRKVGIAAAYLYRKNDKGKRSYGGWSQKKMVEIFGADQKATLMKFINNTKAKDAQARKDKNDGKKSTKPKWSRAYKFYQDEDNKKAKNFTYAKAKNWKKNKKAEFRTGGYTGNWSSDEGKLAVLHKKELVLNAKDTENLLSIINIVRDLTKNAMSGKPTKEQKEMSIKSEALFESLAEIRKELLTMNETDQFLAEKELSKEESMLSLLDNLAVLEEGFREFTGTEFLEALDYLNVFKDTLNTQLNNQNYQNELALSSTEYQAKLFEELNQTLTATILDSAQSHLEKLNTNISHQAQVLTQIADDNKKSFANNKTDIQQEVKVYADFPNATSANEIQKALENLVNAATQHAYTTRR